MAGRSSNLMYAIPIAALLAAACAPLGPSQGSASAGAAQPAPVATGTVTRFLIDPSGEVDGLLLDDRQQVRFSPRLAGAVTATTEPGGRIEVEGTRESSGAIAARGITDARSRRRITEQEAGDPPAPERVPPRQLDVMAAEGRIKVVTHGAAGEVDGVVLEDGSVVRFPVALQREVPMEVFQPGMLIAARGYGTENRFGRALEVMAMTVAPDPAASKDAPAPAGMGPEASR